MINKDDNYIGKLIAALKIELATRHSEIWAEYNECVMNPSNCNFNSLGLLFPIPFPGKEKEGNEVIEKVRKITIAFQNQFRLENPELL